MAMVDEAGLRVLVIRLERAWNGADAEAWGADFAEDADFIHVLGSHFTGRAAIVEGHRTIFSTIYKDSRYALTVEKIRPIDAEAAVVFTLAELTLADGSRMWARPTLVVEHTSGAWKIAAFQNTLVSDGGPAGDAGRALQDHPYPGR